MWNFVRCSYKELLVVAITMKILFIFKLMSMNFMDNDDCEKKISGFPNVEIKPFLSKFKNPCWFQEDGMLRCLPYVFIAGIGKSGTTDLYEKLLRHPDIVRSSVKEPNWLTVKRFGFTMDSADLTENSQTIGPRFYQRSFDYYLAYFDGAASVISQSARRGNTNKITVDGSGSTLVFNNHWWRFHENCEALEPNITIAHYVRYILPGARIIVIMRDPTERLYSDYLYFNDNVSADLFHEEVLNSTRTFHSCLLYKPLRACVYSGAVQRGSKAHLHFGLYHVFLEDWFKVFPRKQFHLIRFEDYIQDRLATIKAIYRFLDVRPLTAKEEKRITKDETKANSNSKMKNLSGPIRADTRPLVEEFYRPYNAKLVKLLGDKKFFWNKFGFF